MHRKIISLTKIVKYKREIFNDQEKLKISNSTVFSMCSYGMYGKCLLKC